MKVAHAILPRLWVPQFPDLSHQCPCGPLMHQCLKGTPNKVQLLLSPLVRRIRAGTLSQVGVGRLEQRTRLPNHTSFSRATHPPAHSNPPPPPSMPANMWTNQAGTCNTPLGGYSVASSNLYNFIFTHSLYSQPTAGRVPLWYPTNFTSVIVSQIVNELRKTLHIILKW